MTGWEHKPVAVWPDRVPRIKAHGAIPDCVNQWGECHRGAGVPGLRSLNSVHRESADGVDGQLSYFVIDNPVGSTALTLAACARSCGMGDRCRFGRNRRSFLSPE